MAGFFAFKKSQQAPTPPPQGDVAYEQHTVQVSQSAPVQYEQHAPQSYNGIGSPPAPAQPMYQQQPPQMVTQTTVTRGQPPQQQMGQQQMPAQQGQQTTVGVSRTSGQPPAPGAPPRPGQPAAGGVTVASNISTQKRGELDIMTHLTQRSNRVFMAANNKARELHNAFLDSEHLLHGLLTDGEIYKLFVDLKIQPQLIEATLIRVYKKESNPALPQIAPRVKRIIENSLIIARKLGFEFISPEHLLLALYDEKEGLGAKILVKLGVKKEDLNKKILGKKEGLEKAGKAEEQAKKGVMEQFTIDLTKKAADGLLDPVVERSVEIERVIHILSRRTKNNPALVGEAGVGKTAVVEGLAYKIVSKQVPESLLEKRILQLDLMGILAGASKRGEFEERMKNLIEDIQNSKGKIIVFIDEIHTIVGAGGSGEGSIDASNFLKPALARGELQLIGATTLTEYRKYIEKDPALERRFQPVLIPEPPEEAAVKMLKALRDKYEAFHRVKIPDDAIEAAVKFSKRYVGDRFLPDKAVDLIDEAASAVRLPLLSLPEVMKSLEDRITQLTQEMHEAQKAKDNVRARILKSKIAVIQGQLKTKKEEYDIKRAQTTSFVTVEIIKDVVSRWTGVPVNKISSSELERLAHLEDIMHKRLIGQLNAVSVVSQAVKRGRAGLKSETRPIGSFVFLGPTGVGKTELAKTLAEVLFDQEESMIRFDMTEYMERHEIAKLLGAPPGYVGYEEGGKLTEAVRRRPYAVVLFDEIEKAHPDIFNILLQILDDGRLTDNKGHVVSFKNAVIICTSNIGSKIIQDELMKSGKMEIEEPPVVSTYALSPHGREILTIGSKFFIRNSKGSTQADKKLDDQPKPLILTTYAFSPRGREILTIGSQYFERDAKAEDQNSMSWKKGPIKDYFTGQKIETPDVLFPETSFDTHAISSQGAEMISKDHQLIYRTSTTSKVWQANNLIEYFKDNLVVNALPDAPDEQLPTARLDSHTYSSDETEIVSFGNRFWRRKQGSTDWETGPLDDYFKDMTIADGTFPTTVWNIHTFSPVGQEIIATEGRAWIRESGQTSWKALHVAEYFGKNPPVEPETKEPEKKSTPDTADGTWHSGMLFDYFDGQSTKSQAKDAQEMADFPVQGFETHTVSPKGQEVITKAAMVWLRENSTVKVWTTTTLTDYFKDQKVTNASVDVPEEQLPAVRLKTHAFAPDGMEIISNKDRYWMKKDETSQWETDILRNYFTGQTVDQGTLPTAHWDIHIITPNGREIIVVGSDLWYREAKQTMWKNTPLKEFFGTDFPLEKELEEKKKIEQENDKKQYGIIKEKVMMELRKFFRPELINRFDEVIIFEPLKFEHMMYIVKLQLKGLAKLLEDQDMDFAYTEAALKEIVRAGFDPIFGARPLRRAIQKLVENPISLLIIEKKAKAGDTILADYDGENFIFNVEKMAMDEPDEEEKKKSFECLSCGTHYRSEVIEHATPICPSCVSKKVRTDETDVIRPNGKKPAPKVVTDPAPEGSEKLPEKRETSEKPETETPQPTNITHA